MLVPLVILIQSSEVADPSRHASPLSNPLESGYQPSVAEKLLRLEAMPISLHIHSGQKPLYFLFQNCLSPGYWVLAVVTEMTTMLAWVVFVGMMWPLGGWPGPGTLPVLTIPESCWVT